MKKILLIILPLLAVTFNSCKKDTIPQYESFSKTYKMEYSDVDHSEIVEVRMATDKDFESLWVGFTANNKEVNSVYSYAKQDNSYIINVTYKNGETAIGQFYKGYEKKSYLEYRKKDKSLIWKLTEVE